MLKVADAASQTPIPVIDCGRGVSQGASPVE